MEAAFPLSVDDLLVPDFVDLRGPAELRFCVTREMRVLPRVRAQLRFVHLLGRLEGGGSFGKLLDLFKQRRAYYEGVERCHVKSGWATSSAHLPFSAGQALRLSVHVVLVA